MAYLSGTTVLGTDATGIARALEAKASPQGWHVEVTPSTYDDCIARAEPFLAHVAGRYLGHAVTVVGMNKDEVYFLDPAKGELSKLLRNEFEDQWDGVAVRLVK
jgi:ABC-type bacteriocin/lantibiotic exporter with double-glycine peptidase domain